MSILIVCAINSSEDILEGRGHFRGELLPYYSTLHCYLPIPPTFPTGCITGSKSDLTSPTTALLSLNVPQTSKSSAESTNSTQSSSSDSGSASETTKVVEDNTDPASNAENGAAAAEASVADGDKPQSGSDEKWVAVDSTQASSDATA